MKSLLPLCLGTILSVAIHPALAADAAKGPPAATKPATPNPTKPSEPSDQKAARHDRELKAAEAKLNAATKEFPLLTGPGWEDNYAKFRAELAKVQRLPEFQRPAPSIAKPTPGTIPAPKSLLQVQQERREADLALMRKQAEQVLTAHPGLRDYVEQQFQWHKRLFELGHSHTDNPRVQQLVRARLATAPGKAQ